MILCAARGGMTQSPSRLDASKVAIWDESLFIKADEFSNCTQNIWTGNLACEEVQI